MLTTKTKRIPELRALCEILPLKSSSSGKKFARVVNLLLFHDGRRNNKKVVLFDDQTGDSCGLDAFEKKRKTISVGHQHKFFQCPRNSDSFKIYL